MFEEQRTENSNEDNEYDNMDDGEGRDEGRNDEGNSATAVFKEQLGERVIKNDQGKPTTVFPPIPKFTQSIRIDVVLSGVLDLSVLKEGGYERVKEIIFKSVKIDPQVISKEGLTEILNIPATVEKIVCKGNKLKHIEPLGLNIKELDLEDNELDDLDFTKLPNLTRLNISHNNFQELGELPSKLKYLNSSYNDIRFLDLDGLNELTHLYINNNKIVSILNIPDKSLKHVSYYNNPLKEINVLENTQGLAIYGENGLIKRAQNASNTDTATTRLKKRPPSNEEEEGVADEEKMGMEDIGEEEEDTELTYKEAIFKYFKMKRNYEKEMKMKVARIKQRTKHNPKKRRMLLASLKGNCVVCKRSVGSIFTKRNNYYTALCGDVGKNPCRLNISIFNGIYYNFFDDMHYFKEYTENSVQEIIKQKMDVLFNYADESGVSKRFEETMKKYTDYNDGFMILYDKYKEIYENPAKKELIRLKNERINEIMSEINGSIVEYRKTPSNIELLREAVERQQKELVKEIVELRRLKYEEMYVLCDSVEKENDEGVSIAPKCLLVQNEHKLDKFVNMIEEPKVIRFNT
jgi:hypothetical protein